MANKLTIEFIKEEFAKEEYILLSKEYKNAHSKLEYICPNGHKHSITWSNWNQGKRCKYCFGKETILFSTVKKSFENEGYILLSNEYKNSKTKLEYECPNHHINSISWNSWQQGHRCPYCYGNVKFNINDIKKSFEKEGYTLLTKEYINNRQKLKYKCPNGHNGCISFDSWNHGHRCSICSGNIKNDLLYIKKSFEKEGYTLLTKEYVNNKQKLDYICPNGHIHNISWSKWLYGRRCPTCAIINNSGPNSSSWKGGKSFEPYCEAWKDKEYKSDIRKRDGNSCLNPYCNSNNPGDLTIHHIDYNKKNCHPLNLITVCRSCNSAANKNREWHKSWYQAIIKKRYNK